MRQFFVEFRFYGYSQYYLKSLTYEIARKFKVKGAIKRRPVPHMTLYGPSSAKDIHKVFAAIERVSKRYRLVPFSIEGFDWHDGSEGKVIACRIRPSRELVTRRRELATELGKVSMPTQWDTQGRYWFHTTIAFKDIDRKFNKIWEHLERQQRPEFDLYLTRITVLGKGKKIIREYDLLLNRWLSRRQVLFNKWYWRRRTERRLLAELQGLPSRSRRSIWRTIVDFLRDLCVKNRVYLIGDTHFDHANIIKYCNRPFKSTREMNKFMINKWNQTVGPKDTVYHLGDWSFGRGARSPSYWGKKLHGQIVAIRGGHDRKTRGVRFEEYRVLSCGEYSFLLVHDPEEKPFDWDGWVIHGHKHNNDMIGYPFINGERKTINVSVELTDYRPVKLDDLVSLNLDAIKYMRTVDS
ncbi:MAG: 2'-5' RNA ligase family protein [Dehalococcoidia bacterium]